MSMWLYSYSIAYQNPFQFQYIPLFSFVKFFLICYAPFRKSEKFLPFFLTSRVLARESGRAYESDKIPPPILTWLAAAADAADLNLNSGVWIWMSTVVIARESLVSFLCRVRHLVKVLLHIFFEFLLGQQGSCSINLPACRTSKKHSTKTFDWPDASPCIILEKIHMDKSITHFPRPLMAKYSFYNLTYRHPLNYGVGLSASQMWASGWRTFALEIGYFRRASWCKDCLIPQKLSYQIRSLRIE